MASHERVCSARWAIGDSRHTIYHIHAPVQMEDGRSMYPLALEDRESSSLASRKHKDSQCSCDDVSALAPSILLLTPCEDVMLRSLSARPSTRLPLLQRC